MKWRHHWPRGRACPIYSLTINVLFLCKDNEYAMYFWERRKKKFSQNYWKTWTNPDKIVLFMWKINSSSFILVPNKLWYFVATHDWIMNDFKWVKIRGVDSGGICIPPRFKVGGGGVVCTIIPPPPPGLVKKKKSLEIETENKIRTFLALIICKLSFVFQNCVFQ